MTTGKQKVPVTARALIQRINRKLAPDNERLKQARGARARLDAGAVYRIDLEHNFLVEKDVDIEELGRELGVLAAYEELESES